MDIPLGMISTVIPPLVNTGSLLAIQRQGRSGPGYKSLVRIGEMDFGDCVVVPLHPDLVRFHQHVGMREAVRRFEAV